jgi:hypothetical protein
MRKFALVLLFLIACAPVELKEAATSPTPQPEVVQAPEIVQTPEPVVIEPEPAVEIEAPVPEVVEVEIAEEPGDCDTFGCFPGDKVVADMEMDLYYDCSCQRARWIKPEMVLCFENEEAAVERGYRKAQSC